MSFVKTQEEMAKLDRKSFDFYDAEFVSIYWETKPEIIKRLLPPPLKPAKYPVANAFIANYPKTNFGAVYKEGALFLYAEYGDVTGIYCLAMPVDDDMALVYGRECFGYPKKMSNITLEISDKEAQGSIERHGVTYFEMNVKLNNKLNAKDALQISMDLGLNPQKPSSTTYNFKYFKHPNFEKFDYNPRLIRELITMQAIQIKMGQAEITLNPSEFDPWNVVSVERMLGAIYIKTNSQMQPGEVVSEISQVEFKPYSYVKVDPY